MTPPTCRVPSCDKPSLDGPACRSCLRRLLADLRGMPWLVEQLEVTRSGLDRLNRAKARRDRGEAAMGYRPKAAEVAGELHGELVGWARVLWEVNAPWLPSCSLCGVPQYRHAQGPPPRERSWPLAREPIDSADSPAAVAGWLLRHERWILRHDAVDEMVRDISKAVRAVLRVIDLPPELCTYGICNAPLDDELTCPGYVYGLPNQETVTCRECGYQHDTSYRTQCMREDMEDMLFTAGELARVLPRLIGQPVKVNTVRHWAHIGKVKTHRGDESETLYRAGDVITLALTTPTRQRRSAAAAG